MSADFIKIWEQALEAIKEEISPVAYKTYVEVMIPRLTDENTVCFLAPSNYHIEVINRKYLDLIANTLMILTNKNYILTFESKEMGGSEEDEDIPVNRGEPQQTYTKDETTKPVDNITNPNANTNPQVSTMDSGLNPKYTFEYDIQLQ